MNEETEVNAKIEILRVSTGEKRLYDSLVHFVNSDDDWRGERGSFLDFIWTEGNFACDCNRASFFYSAANEEEPDELPCGSTAYKIPRIICEDGRIIEIDD